jgi:hypothetical protein
VGLGNVSKRWREQVQRRIILQRTTPSRRPLDRWYHWKYTGSKLPVTKHGTNNDEKLVVEYSLQRAVIERARR